MTEPMDPDRLEQVEFAVVRRGVDPDSVRSTLAEAADALRLANRRRHELEHRIETLEAQLPDPDRVDTEREAVRAEARAEGEAEGDRRREVGQDEADTIVAEAKAEGRRLVGEAQTVRRRMLEDLARRRRALRQQIEQLRGGRERLLEAYEVVGHTMREATDELAVALPEARAAAERAGHGVGPEGTAEQLEREIESARLAGLPIVAEPVADPEPAAEHSGRRRPIAVPLERDVRDMPEVEPLVADFEDVRVLPDEVDAPVAAEADAAAVPDEAPGEAGREGPQEPGDLDARQRDGPVAEAGPEGGADDVTPDGSRGHDDANDGDDDLFSRLRQAQPPADARPDDAIVDPVATSPGPDEAGADPGDPAAATSPGPDDARADPGDEGLDHPDDAAEPFGLVLGSAADAESEDVAAAGRATAEHELARRLKRLLSDEQNDVLDRLRRTRKRTLEVTDLLDDFDQRVARFADAVQPALADASAAGAGERPHPVDDLAAELAREVAEALVDGIVEPLEEDRPVDELAGPVRALYRDWKTDRIGALAERYVEAAYEPSPPAP